MEPLFKCDDCTKAFVYKHQLVQHRRTHSAGRPYKCGQCGAQFAGASHLKRHSNMQHGIDSGAEEKLHICPDCHKVFRDRRVLAKHRRIHTGIKPYKCDYCEKTFVAQSDCKKHMRIHTGEKPYQCELCSKQFTFSNSYRIHMRNHAGIKPFSCQFCGKTFSCSSDRSKHVKSHNQSTQTKKSE